MARYSGTLFSDVDDAIAWRKEMRDKGKRVVFTNGCFDVLHMGHVQYLAAARAKGNVLLVGLNKDESVRLIKGSSRPIVPFEQRARILCALRSVNAVVGFGERTPETLLDQICPDVHVKSDQYSVEELPERTVVLEHGGTIELVPHVIGVSTTDTIARILDAYRRHG